MMMIKGTIGTSVNHLFPADRCSWLQVDNADRGYSVTAVVFYPGALASAGGDTAATVHDVTAASLGFIGKSGRFTAISN